MKNQKLSAKRSLAVVLSLALAAAPLAIATDANAAAKPTIAKKATITAGKSKKLSISKNGFTIKKVSARTSAKKIATVKATKKAITIKAAKKGSATITTTIKAAKGKKKAKSYKATTKVTVKAAAVKAVTVNTLAGLESALASAQKSGAAVTLKTDEAGTLEIKAADYTKVALTVDAPNADIVNAAKFKSVTIKAIKASTWTEKALGNKLEVAATTATRIVVDAAASVASIVYSGTSAATSKVEVLGTVNNISVESNTPVEVSAAGASAKVAEIDVKAEGVKVDITADATATISTVKVEANASVSVGGTSNNPTSVQKIPTATVVVTAPNATTTEITPQPSASPAASASPSASASASPSASATPAKSEEPATGAGGSVDAFDFTIGTLADGVYTAGSKVTLSLSVTKPADSTDYVDWYETNSASRPSTDPNVYADLHGENLVLESLNVGTHYFYAKVAVTSAGQTIEKYSNVATIEVKAASVAITFNLNGGKIGSSTDDKIVNYAEGALISSQLPENPTKDNSTFDGWYTAASSGTKLADDAVADATATYYAQWTNNTSSPTTTYSVTYEANGGSGAPSKAENITGEYTIDNTVPTKSENYFTGWKVGSTNTIKKGGDKITVTENVTLTAQWETVAEPSIASENSLVDKEYDKGATSVTALDASSTVSDGGKITYQWYKNTTNSTTGGEELSGQTNATFTPPVSAAGENYYYCIITNTKENATKTKTTKIVKIKVNENQ